MESGNGLIYEFRSSDFCIMTERVDDGNMWNYHCHNFYELYYLESGRREYLIGQNSYTVMPGYFVLVKPHVMHQTFGGPFKRYLIHFGYDFLKDYVPAKILDELLAVFDVPVIVPEVMLGTASKYWDVLAEFQGSGDMRGFALSLASLLSFLHKHKGGVIPIKDGDLVSRIADYIEKNALTLNSLDEIAEYFNMSKYYLCHLFQKEKNISAYDYLTSLKIAHASYILSTTERKIKDIAYECGFQSEYYFSRRFKQIMDMSPRDYRKLILKKEQMGTE